MSKFFNLCSCEFTKIMKKKSSKVMLIILIVSIFAAAGLSVLTKKMYSLTSEFIESDSYENNVKAELESFKTDLNNNKDNLDEVSKNELQAKIDTYQFAVDNNINLYKAYWKSDVLSTDVYDSKISYYNYKSIGDEEAASKEQSYIDQKLELIKNDNYSEYMKLKKDILKQNLDAKLIEQDTYDLNMRYVELREKYEIGKEYNADTTWKESIVEEMKLLEGSIRAGADLMTGKAFSDKELKKAKDTLKIDEYRLEHNMTPYMTDSSVGNTRKIFDYMVGSITMMVLAVMMIIIAGGSISTEIAKGTIKFWSFTPNKRWKILLSKLVVSVVILVITTVGITLLSTLIGNLFFGSGNAQGYLYVSGGEVHVINYIVYAILYNLIGAIDILIFLLFAMMLSTVARNTAVAVGVSIAAYFGGSTIMQLVNMFVKSDWIKFIPFNNLSLTDRIFTNDVSYSASTMISNITGNISVGFSVAVLGVCAVLMIITMFDSFRKRDII